MAILLKQIYIDERVIDNPMTRRIIEKTPGIPHQIVNDEDMEDQTRGISITRGKRILYLTSRKGDMIKPCPGTLPPYLCCQYTIINQMTQCPMDCTYCVLQDYLDHPVIALNTDFSRIFDSIDKHLADRPDRFYRFGTGELTDSLVFDDIAGLYQEYAQFFSAKTSALIEFKTKTNNIEQLLQGPTRNVVVSWSINPQKIVKTEEFNTASVKARLRAAQQCMDKGFLLGLHFDPILWIPDWESLYREVIQKIFSTVEGSRIAWVSLGTLRFPPSLKRIVRSRFPKSRIVYQEMIQGLDGKKRYPKPIRVEMYRKIFGWLKEKAPDLFIYFCMESPEVWDRVMGTHPGSNGELDFWFARSLYRRFPELCMEEPQRVSYVG